jgi:hypothetical protein
MAIYTWVIFVLPYIRDFEFIIVRTCSQQDFEGYHRSFTADIGEEGQVRTIILTSELEWLNSSSYIPGWDCHGLPIENKALQELGVRLSIHAQYKADFALERFTFS